MRTVEKEKKSEKRKKKIETSLSLKFHGLLKNYSVKAIMVTLIRVHEKGCLYCWGPLKRKKKSREKKKEEREKLVAGVSWSFEKQ